MLRTTVAVAALALLAPRAAAGQCGGKIHAAEAILETLPIGAPSGWDK